MVKLFVILMMALAASCSTAVKGSSGPDNGKDPESPVTQEPAETPGPSGGTETPTYKAFSFIQMSDPQLAFHTGDASDFVTDTLTLDTLVRQINRLRPPFVIVTGDMTDNSTNKAQLAAYRKVIDRVSNDIPVHHLPGNHDVGSACSKAKVAAFEQNYGPSKFSFTYENCALIGLNTCAIFAANPSSGDPSAEAAEIAEEQWTWLVSELKAAQDKGARIVFGHYPVFVKSFGEDRSTNNFLPSEREKYWNLFKQYKVAAFGCGHTHYPYESTYLGIDAVTCGAVAAPLGKGYRGAVLWTVSAEGKVSHKYLTIQDFVRLRSL